MDDPKILVFLTKLYFMKGQQVRFQILDCMGLDRSGRHYKILEKLVNHGYLKKVSENPDTFEVGKDEKTLIWNTFKRTETGKNIIEMIRDNTFLVDV